MVEVFYVDTENIKKGKLEKLTSHKTWIRVVNPTLDKIELLSQHTKIPLEELKESLEEEERPKVSSGDYLEIIYRAPYTVSQDLETLPIYFYLFRDKLITIEKKPLPIMEKISSEMSKNKNKFLFKRGFPYFIFHVIDQINDDYLLKIDKIAARIDIYENFSKREMTVNDIERMYDQSVTLSFFNQALIANVEVLNSLRKGYFNLLRPRDKHMFEELYYNVLQIVDTEKVQREAITNLINVQAILTSTRLNQFMKRLTSIALIVAIPTLLSGIYGMNFKYIPLAEHRYGFWIISGIMIIISIMFLYLFEKLDWL